MSEELIANLDAMGAIKQPTGAASPRRKRSPKSGSMGKAKSIAPVRATRRNWLMMAAMSLMTLVFLLQMHASFSFLGSMGSSSQRLRGQLAWMEAANALDPFGAKKGIILCLHDGIAAMGASLIRELRCLGNREVVQVYHCLDSELSPKSRAVLTRNDPLVEIIDVCADLEQRNVQLPASVGDAFQSYWIKPLALTHTSLTEVILLDADAILLRDPAELRATKGYRDHGSVFFYDRVTGCHKFLNKHAQEKQLLRHIVANFDYKRFGIEGPKPSDQLLNSLAYNERTCHEQDSSMVVVNKAQASRAMDVLWYLISSLRFRYRFSWGDKEAFWLAYELAQQDYYFSPYGLSLVDSVPNQDLALHNDTLCGSMAHFMPPVSGLDEPPELLYVNGKALLEPYPLGLEPTSRSKASRMFNLHPTHVTPRYERAREFSIEGGRKTSFECLDHMGAQQLPTVFQRHLMRRRMHFFAVETEYYEPLDSCHVY